MDESVLGGSLNIQCGSMVMAYETGAGLDNLSGIG